MKSRLKYVVLSIIFICLCVYWIYSKYQTMDHVYSKLAKIISHSLDNDTLLGQIFFVYLPPFNRSDEFEKKISILKPGGLFVQRSSLLVNSITKEQNIRKLTDQLSKLNTQFLNEKIPAPFIGTDQEYGRVQRIYTGVTDFPSAMAIGEALAELNDLRLATQLAFHSCRQLKKIGIQWPFSPVVDIQTHPENSVIGIRSFGSDPKFITDVARAYINGLHLGRCMDTIKHYPGHGGVETDSHLAIPVVHKKMEELLKEELYPFKNLISKNEPWSVMVGHILFPGSDPHIATFSEFWTSHLLKEKWNFKGIVITDDLGMKAATPELKKKMVFQSALRSFEAGTDMLLMVAGSDSFAIDIKKLFLKKLKQGNISRNRFLSSVEKIIYYKLKLGILDPYLKKISLPDHAKEVEDIMKYTQKQNKRIKYLLDQFHSAEELNRILANASVKSLYNKKADIDPKGSVLYTDLNESHPKYKRLLKLFSSFQNEEKYNKNVLPLDHIYLKNPIAKHPRKFILHLAENNFKKNILPYLRSRDRSPTIILTTVNPFPHSSLGKYLQKRDTLVTSFSNSKASKEALIDALLAGKEIHTSAVRINAPTNSLLQKAP